MVTRKITIKNVNVGGDSPLAVIAGPCVVENRDLIFRTANRLCEITSKYGVSFIFKSSYKKANRTSLSGFTTIGIDESLKILSDVQKEFHIPVLTDVHTIEEVEIAASVADVLQIPAFLCRQTDLLTKAGESGKPINVKKGQFLAPDDMKYVIEKIIAVGNQDVLLCERGTTFGYHNLVVDMRSLVMMRKFGYPVVFDATHSVQLPSVTNMSGGEPEFIYPLARAAAAVGIDALFIETHPNPAQAMSDAASQLPLDSFESLLQSVLAIDRCIRRTNDVL